MNNTDAACRRDPDLIFTEKYSDVYYQVHAWKEDNGIALALPMFGTFMGLVLALNSDAKEEQLRIISLAERSRCLLRAAKEFGIIGKNRKIRFCEPSI